MKKVAFGRLFLFVRQKTVLLHDEIVIRQNTIIMKKLFSLLLLAAAFCSCSPKIHKNIIKQMPYPNGTHSEVTVYDTDDVVPDNAEVIGSLSVGDGGFTTHCDWETIIETAKKEAKTSGGNGLEILQHSYPGENSSNCHQIVAYILNIDDNAEPIGLSDFALKNFTDYVVFGEGDTIKCRVTENEKDYLTVIYERNGVRRYRMLGKNKLLAYHIDDPVALAEQQSERDRKDFHVCIGLDGGWAYRTAPLSSDISDDYKDYLRSLKKGSDLSANLKINIENILSLGLQYDRFTAGCQADAWFADDEGNVTQGTISDAITITFIGGSFGMFGWVSNNKKHLLHADFIFGYMGYEDAGEEFGTQYVLKGKTFGTGYAFGYDFKITKHIAIGEELSYYKGSLKNMEYWENGYFKDGIDLGNSREGLQRINLKAGLRFYL